MLGDFVALAAFFAGCLLDAGSARSVAFLRAGAFFAALLAGEPAPAATSAPVPADVALADRGVEAATTALLDGLSDMIWHRLPGAAHRWSRRGMTSPHLDLPHTPSGRATQPGPSRLDLMIT